MKAEQRHQLKQNELAEALARLRDFDSPSTRYMLLGLVVVVVLLVGWKGWRYSHRQTLEQGWQRLGMLEMAMLSGDENRLAVAAADARNLIQETSDPALLSAARLWLARVRTDEGLKEPARRQAALSEGAELLREILSTPKTPPMMEAAATFALATNHESLRQLEQAKELYAKLTTDLRFKGSPYVDKAHERLETLDALRTPVAMISGDPPAAAPQVELEGPPAPTEGSITIEPLGPGQEPPFQLPPELSPTPVPPSPGSPAPEAPAQPAPEKPQPEEPQAGGSESP